MMKFSNQLSRRAIRVTGTLAAMPLLFFALTGCLTPTIHKVNRTVVATNVMNATLDQLVERMDAQFAAIQTLNASVDITASSGGEHQGEVKEIPAFAGYLFLRKPADLRVLLLLPFVRSRALDMVSDGKTFKLLVPPKNKAITGSDDVVEMPVAAAREGAPKAPSGLETLRPNIIRDALLIPALGPEEYITLTENSRVMQVPGKKDKLEEPDYDLTVLRKRAGQVLERVRVIHIGRITLQPYEQDIYDHQGRVVTTVMYDKFQKFGDVEYPTSIFIRRPLDEYTLKIDVTKLQLNGKLDDEQFALKIPENVPVQKM